jgi:hypothetical protein
MRPLVLRYAFSVGLGEWQRCDRISPGVRVAVIAAMGALVAPFVVFVSPLARLYWLTTGKQPPRLFGFLSPHPYVVVMPFQLPHPQEIREVLDRPEHKWEPGPGDISRWYDSNKTPVSVPAGRADGFCFSIIPRA